MLSKKTKKRGLAILTTLLIIVLLLGLIAAFLTVNRAGNRFTLSSVERRQAQDACLTAFAYAQYQLEKDPGWGHSVPVSGTDPYPAGNPQVQMELSQVDTQLALIQGKFSASGNLTNPTGSFEMKVWNNLEPRGALATPGDGPVAGRTVKIRVDSKVGGVQKTLVAVLRPIPQSYDSLAAGGSVNLDETAGLVRIESKDPYVNRISANGDLNLPPADDVQFLKHGIGAAGGALNLGGTDVLLASDEDRADEGAASGGVYMKNDHPSEVKAFDPNDYALPNNSTAVEAGTWQFGEIDHQEYRPQPVEFREVTTDAFGNVSIDEGSVTRYRRVSSVYNRLTSPSGRVYPAGVEIAGTEVVDPAGDPPTFSSEGGAEGWGYDNGSDGFPSAPGALAKSDVHTIAPGFQANVQTAQMVVHAETALTVAGDFLVEAGGNRLPELYFGYRLSSGGVATQTSLDDGVEAAQNEPSKYMAGIRATGDINVTGGVLGYGSMLAGGDLTIKASSGLRTAPGLGVVAKGNRVIINPATEPEPGFPGEPVDADYPVFQGAITAQAGGNWANYEGWLDHDQPTREGIIDLLKEQSASASAATIWGTLNTQIGAGLAMPTLPGWPSGNITVEQYVRLKEFYQTRASGYKNGDGDETWLDLEVRDDDAAGRVGNVVTGIAHWANSYKQNFQQYLNNSAQGVPDMFLEGLLFADEDILINADNKSVRLEGSVVARNGDVDIAGASQVTLVYNRTLLDDLQANIGNGSRKLQKVFFTLD